MFFKYIGTEFAVQMRIDNNVKSREDYRKLNIHLCPEHSRDMAIAKRSEEVREHPNLTIYLNGRYVDSVPANNLKFVSISDTNTSTLIEEIEYLEKIEEKLRNSVICLFKDIPTQIFSRFGDKETSIFCDYSIEMDYQLLAVFSEIVCEIARERPHLKIRQNKNAKTKTETILDFVLPDETIVDTLFLPYTLKNTELAISNFIRYNMACLEES